MRYSNPWNGSGNFYKGKRKKLTTATTDKGYQAYLRSWYKSYCKKEKNKATILSYEDWCKRKNSNKRILSYANWCKRERIRYGMF